MSEKDISLCSHKVLFLLIIICVSNHSFFRDWLINGIPTMTTIPPVYFIPIFFLLFSFLKWKHYQKYLVVILWITLKSFTTSNLLVPQWMFVRLQTNKPHYSVIGTVISPNGDHSNVCVLFTIMHLSVIFKVSIRISPYVYD